MRTHGERTSGAWTCGCEVKPGGGKEETALQATSTATPNNTQGSMIRNSYSSKPWRTCSMPDPTSLREHNEVLAKVKYL